MYICVLAFNILSQLKVFFSYLLLFSLAFRPLYNVGYVAYFKLNIDNIIETYCVNKAEPKLQCNGKCHLADQLVLSSGSKSPQETSFLGAIYEAFIPVYFQDYNTEISVNHYKTVILNHWNYYIYYNSVYLQNQDPPPQLA